MYIGRFAPSPTGPLHLGNAFAAWVAHARARNAGGKLILRVEDLDTPRVVSGCEQEQLDDLAWLGITWDELYRQSERGPSYESAIQRLITSKRIYACTCSRKQLQVSSAPHGAEGPRYPGTCRDLGLPLKGRALRFDTRGCEQTFVDAWFGARSEDVDRERGDFIVRRADAMIAYQLAVVVDDIAMGITEVVRGVDLIDSTSRQLCLYQALEAVAPRFAHVPLVVAANGEKLSKRAPSHTLRGLRQAGVSVTTLRAWLDEASARGGRVTTLPAPDFK